MKNLTINKLTLLLSMTLTMPIAEAITPQTQQNSAGLYENRTCQQLYLAASQLEAQSLNYESDIYNERNNQIASIVSTVFTPALFFLGYSNYMSFKSERDAYQSNAELNKIRYRMAEMRCFYQ